MKGSPEFHCCRRRPRHLGIALACLLCVGSSGCTTVGALAHAVGDGIYFILCGFVPLIMKVAPYALLFVDGGQSVPVDMQHLDAERQMQIASQLLQQNEGRIAYGEIRLASGRNPADTAAALADAHGRPGLQTVVVYIPAAEAQQRKEQLRRLRAAMADANIPAMPQQDDLRRRIALVAALGPTLPSAP